MLEFVRSAMTSSCGCEGCTRFSHAATDVSAEKPILLVMITNTARYFRKWQVILMFAYVGVDSFMFLFELESAVLSSITAVFDQLLTVSCPVHFPTKKRR